MLTPVDIQQKKFKTGIGLDKKDVITFFNEVSSSYSELYRSNAELKEKVITLTDTVQHYKTTEENLQKKLMLADKNSEEQMANAEKSAKAIELEAQNRAAEIVKDAKESLASMENQLESLKAEYSDYKAKVVELSGQMFQFLEVHDFDNSPLFGGFGYGGGYATSVSVNSTDSEYSENSQIHDNSADLNSSVSNGSNSTNVYGTTLGGDGIDPFKALKGDEDFGSLFMDNATDKQKSKIPLHTKKITETAKKGNTPDDDSFMFT